MTLKKTEEEGDPSWNHQPKDSTPDVIKTDNLIEAINNDGENKGQFPEKKKEKKNKLFRFSWKKRDKDNDEKKKEKDSISTIPEEQTHQECNDNHSDTTRSELESSTLTTKHGNVDSLNQEVMDDVCKEETGDKHASTGGNFETVTSSSPRDLTCECSVAIPPEKIIPEKATRSKTSPVTVSSESDKETIEISDADGMLDIVHPQLVNEAEGTTSSKETEKDKPEEDCNVEDVENNNKNEETKTKKKRSFLFRRKDNSKQKKKSSSFHSGDFSKNKETSPLNEPPEKENISKEPETVVDLENTTKLEKKSSKKKASSLRTSSSDSNIVVSEGKEIPIPKPRNLKEVKSKKKKKKESTKKVDGEDGITDMDNVSISTGISLTSFGSGDDLHGKRSLVFDDELHFEDSNAFEGVSLASLSDEEEQNSSSKVASESSGAPSPMETFRSERLAISTNTRHSAASTGCYEIRNGVHSNQDAHLTDLCISEQSRHEGQLVVNRSEDSKDGMVVAPTLNPQDSCNQKKERQSAHDPCSNTSVIRVELVDKDSDIDSGEANEVLSNLTPPRFMAAQNVDANDVNSGQAAPRISSVSDLWKHFDFLEESRVDPPIGEDSSVKSVEKEDTGHKTEAIEPETGHDQGKEKDCRPDMNDDIDENTKHFQDTAKQSNEHDIVSAKTENKNYDRVIDSKEAKLTGNTNEKENSELLENTVELQDKNDKACAATQCITKEVDKSNHPNGGRAKIFKDASVQVPDVQVAADGSFFVPILGLREMKSIGLQCSETDLTIAQEDCHVEEKGRKQKSFYI